MEANLSTRVAAALKQRQNEFIEKRTVTESEVNKFLKSLEGLDPDVKAQLKVVDGATARDWLPSLWLEEPDPKQYEAEKAKLDAYIAAVKNYADHLAQEAIRCLQV